MNKAAELIEQDLRQRVQALDASQSFIVQAPAGSGKTELLIQRLLTLLTHVQAPEEILAITFTKKAANEMRMRVLKALKQASSEPEPESAHAKKTWHLARQVLQRDQQYHWDIIANPNQLRIQTIDALCAYLTKQLPLLSHFGSQPDIADNAETLYREAVSEVLAHVEENYEWSDAIAKLLLHVDNDLNRLHDLFVSLLAKRDQWLPYLHFEQDDQAIKAQLEKHLEAVVTDHLHLTKQIFPNLLSCELLAVLNFAAGNLARTNLESEIAACEHLTALPPTNAAALRLWRGIAKLLLTKSEFTWRKQINNEIGFPPLSSMKNPLEKASHTAIRARFSALLSALHEHEDVRIALRELFFLPNPYYQATQWEILQSMLRVLKILAAQLRLTFQQHGQIDFIENAHAALAALGQHDSPTDLALALDYQIRHILVDEFQDTSHTQYQLLVKLTTGWDMQDGRTLFVVGDPMQSIYRFREAEVGLFMRMRQHGIGNIQLTPLTLALNFRSTPQLVEWNNTHFKTIFPAFNDIATGAVTYSPSVAKEIPLYTPQNTSIAIQGFKSADGHTQAQHVVALISRTKAQFPDEKIAILVRSRGHLAQIIPALKAAKLNFRAIDIDPLASRPHIQDLLSLTCALLHPADRIAWLAVLRAPWCGLTLADLLVIAGSNPHATLWEQFDNSTTQNNLSADGKVRLRKTLAILRQKIAERERYDLRSWIENTWQLLGGPACLQEFTDIDDTNAYFKLLENMTQSKQIINMENLKKKISRLFATSSQDDASLQIMTIHTAKGLEFDTVILPHMERKMPSDDKNLLSWMERPLTNQQLALLLAPIHRTGDDKEMLYEYIQRQQKMKSDYEINRLLYVATTRAKKRLHIFFNATDREERDFNPESGSFLQKLWPLIKHQSDLIQHSESPEQTINTLAQLSRGIRRVTSDWSNPITEIERPYVSAHQQNSGFLLPDKRPQIVGVIIHRILQFISKHGINWWQKQTQQNQENYIRRQLQQLGMTKDFMAATRTILHAIQNTLSDARGLWLLSAQKDAQSEYAISTMIAGKAESLVIDRTFIDADGIRWIIDYKTTALTQQDIHDFLEHEKEKYLLKMKKYQIAMQAQENQIVKFGLYFPVIPAWKEWNSEV